MVASSHPGTLERTIHFYRADIGTDASGSPLPFDPAPALSVIEALPYTSNDDGRYLFDEEGNALSLRRHSAVNPTTVIFGRVRRNGLPQVEQSGTITDLTLGPDSGLWEVIHVLFFANNIVGAEYNHFAPRPSSLAGYIHKKSNETAPRPVFRPLLRLDAASQLARLREIRLMKFDILPTYIEAVRQSDQSLAEAFDANANVLGGAQTLHLTLEPDTQRRTNSLNRLLAPLRELIGDTSKREGITCLQVRGRCEDSGKVETIDLLKDHLIMRKGIVRMNPRSRALDTDSAIQAIREAYDELRPELEAAASISP